MSKSHTSTRHDVSFAPVVHAFARYSFLIYLILISLGVTGVVLFSLSLFSPATQTTAGGDVAGAFDNQTINNLRDDAKKSEQTSFKLPSGRINPFGE